jgi:hypothetical protein
LALFRPRQLRHTEESVVDAVQLVQEAVLNGTIAAVQDETSGLVSGAMRGLYAALFRSFAADRQGHAVVEKLQKCAPQEAVFLSEQLRTCLHGLSEPVLRELVAQAQAVLAATDPAGTAVGRYAVPVGTAVVGNVQVQAPNGVAGWNVGNVTMNMGVPADPSVPGR